MADEEKKDAEGGEEKKKAGGGLMGILIPVLSSAVTAAIVGAVMIFVLAPKPEAAPPAEEGGHGAAAESGGHGGGGGHAPAQPEAAAAEAEFSEEEFDPYAKKQHTGKFFQYDPLTISIFDREKVHYLRLKVVFEISDDGVKEELNVKDPQIKDSLIFVLGDFTVRELLDNQAKLLVKEVLLKTLNRLLGKGKVVDIYFTEFVVQ